MKALETGMYAKSYSRYIDGNGWVETDLWARINGEFHQLVPPNCIILYDTADHGCVVADGNNGTLNVVDLFPRLGRDEVNPAIGSEMHDGTGHGTSSATTSSYSHAKDMYKGVAIGGDKKDLETKSHTHSVNSHSHSGEGSNIPSFKGLVPTMFSDVIYKDAVFLNAENITEQMWFEIVNYAMQLRFTSTPSSEVSSVHTHNSSSVATTKSSYTVKTDPGTTDSSRYNNHAHSAAHTMNGVAIQPYAKNYLTYKTKQMVFFDQLIKGTVVLCTSSYIPQGWSRYSPEESGIF